MLFARSQNSKLVTLKIAEIIIEDIYTEDGNDDENKIFDFLKKNNLFKKEIDLGTLLNYFGKYIDERMKKDFKLTENFETTSETIDESIYDSLTNIFEEIKSEFETEIFLKLEENKEFADIDITVDFAMYWNEELYELIMKGIEQ